MGYNITLTNTIFDSENDNVILFNNKQELKTYWENKEDKITIPDINFIARNIINTEISIAIPVGLSLLKLLNYNYCILFNENETLYFFIEESSQEDGNLVNLRLKIDAWNTYMYDIKDMQGLATRSHLDRFLKTPDGNYVFNFGADSPLFEREKIQGLSKRPTKKFKLQAQYDTTPNSALNNWINENVECWKYYYISAGKNYKYNGYNQDDTTINREQELYSIQYDFRNSDINGSMIVLYAPIYKTNKWIYFRNKDTQRESLWTESAIEYFLKNNDNYSNVFSIKLSPISPFDIREFNSNDYIIENNDLIIKDRYSDSSADRYDLIDGEGQVIKQGIYDFCRNGNFNTYAWIVGDKTTCFGLCKNQNISKNIKMSIPDELYKIKYSRNEIINNNNIEPKLYNEDYSNYRLYFGGKEYDLPVSKTSNKPNFIYKEILNSDITKSILIFNPNDEEDLLNTYFETVFNEYTTKDYTGLISTLDMSLWFSTDRLDEYLANNKNNLQILNNTQDSKALQSGLNAVGSIATGITSSLVTMNPIGAVGGISQAITGVGNTLISNGYEMANYNLTLDNMRNSKQELQSLNSNSILMASVDEIGLYIELESPLEFEFSVIRDNLKMFGYTYNRIADLKTIWKTRRYYNYVEMLIYEIDANISNQVKDYIKEIFKNGVRIWHNDNFSKIDYNLNNIERSVYYGN